MHDGWVRKGVARPHIPHEKRPPSHVCHNAHCWAQQHDRRLLPAMMITQLARLRSPPTHLQYICCPLTPPPSPQPRFPALYSLERDDVGEADLARLVHLNQLLVHLQRGRARGQACGVRGRGGYRGGGRGRWLSAGEVMCTADEVVLPRSLPQPCASSPSTNGRSAVGLNALMRFTTYDATQPATATEGDGEVE
jgi:hypothetical protein